MTNTSYFTNRDAHGERFVAQDLIGQTIEDRYTIRELIAQGGTSIIYKAWDKQLKRMIALKVIVMPRTVTLPSDEERIQRFKREGKGLAQMDHPNIVRVFDAGVDEDILPYYHIYYIAMKFIEGETLRERLQKLEANGERMAWAEVLAIIKDVATALEYAHGHEFEFVHRDVTPSNIMLAGNQAYLFDFGLLKALSLPVSTVERKTFADFKTLTIDGMAMGTPGYWPPEQIKGIKIDRRADIYSLGGVLYHMLTGHMPYEDDALGLACHLYEPPPKPSDVDPALFAFDAVVARAMAKDPSKRYSSAGELAQELEASLSLTPDPIRGQELAAAQEVANKIPMWLGGVFAILGAIALVLFVGVRYLGWFQPSRALPPGWQSFTKGISMVETEDDDYSVTVTDRDASYTIYSGEKLENPHISLDMELRSGPLETAYGLIFQHMDDSNYCVFAITGSGQVGIWRRRDNYWLVLENDGWVAQAEASLAWVSRKYIHTHKPNHLEITIGDGEVRGSINNQPEFNAKLDAAQPGNIGFFVSTSREAKDPKATIRFTNFTIRK